MNSDLENFLAGGIEAQEKAEQQKFVADQTLPKECPKKDLETLGFIFGPDIDELFVQVQFPHGWVKQPTEHSMWSNLLDTKKRIRGQIFYKAVCYDRRAEMFLARRFSVKENYTKNSPNLIQYHVSDKCISNKAIFSTEQSSAERNSVGEYFALHDELAKIAKEWLNKNFPEWENPTKYWD